MTFQTIDILNKILQGEQMLVELQNIFLTRIDNSYLGRQLFSLQKEHLEHQEILIKRIKELGGKPQKEKGNIKIQLIELVSKAKSTVYADYVDILKDLINGHLMGIDKTQQIIYDRLEKEDLEIIQNILSQEIEQVRKLKALVNELEYQRIH